jgi:phytanoyl-CoA hydroxylase
MIAPEQIRQYREQGYVAIHDLLSPEEIDELNRHAASVVTGRAALTGNNRIWMEPDAEEQNLVKDGPDPEYLFKIGHQMHMDDPVFQKYAIHPRIVEILRKLVGRDIKCVQSMFLDKPPHLGVGQPYHQDSWYLKTDPDSLMAVWIACDDAEVDNGCLFVVPGSHRDPIHPHEKPLDPRQRKIYIEVHSARTRVEQAIPLKTGSAAFFTGHTLHRSGHNTTMRHRRAYVLHYADARSRWLNDPAARNPFLLVHGREYPGNL